MRKRLALLLVLAAVGSMGAEFRTTNFVVINPNAQVCQQVGQWAEHYRREKAIQWLGREMPNWPEPCPLRVNVTYEAPSGATEFTFGYGGVTSMRMQIQGPLERLIHSVLPHEVTHTVFAFYFKQPVPRWADEGGSVLSEDDVERDRHDQLVRSILNRGQQLPMRTLFSLKEYPPQVMCLYAEGYSMCDYLVKRSNRQQLLAFVATGMQQNGRNWDQAVKSYYGHNSVEELEQAWLKHLRDTKKQLPNQAIAQNQTNPASAAATGGFAVNTGGKIVRTTVPPAQPLDPQPIARGAMPTPDQVGQKFSGTSWQPSVQLLPPVPIAGSQPPIIPASTSAPAAPRFEVPTGLGSRQ